MLLPLMGQAQTLEECQRSAERNYPLIRQYDLIGKTTQLTVSNISKGWLPQVSVSVQGTLQNDVVSWPDEMQSVYRQIGLDMKGLQKDQYKIGIDVSQTVYDGGVIRHQKNVAECKGDVEEAQTEVTMYQIRRRVNEMYFGLLLLDEQIALNSDLQELLANNERKFCQMYTHGTAAESDYLNVKAERLKVMQQFTNLQSQRRSLARMLGAFCGMKINKVEKPVRIYDGKQLLDIRRPELKVIDAQLRLANAQEKSLHATLMPRLGVFAQGFYGYLGYNMFKDMMRHELSLNGMIGARLLWNIGVLYTHKNDKAKIQLQRDMMETNRDVFLFNNKLEQIQLQDNIERYNRLMTDDDEIISLRSSVRKAAESKLTHGIIDVNDLIKEINAENNALKQKRIHETEMLKEMYDLKYATNN